MANEKTCQTCRFQGKDNSSACLAEACYAGDMWEPEESEDTPDIQKPSAFSEGDRENIYNDFMKSAEY